MDKSERILLNTNVNLQQAQQRFNDVLLPKLNDVLATFNAVGFGELTAADFKRKDGKEIFREKAAQKLQGTEINGIKLRTDKLFELMDIDGSSFILQFDELKKFIFSYREGNGRMQGVDIDFNINFFIVGKDSIALNNDYFNEWFDARCNLYTTTEAQNKMVKDLNTICDGFTSAGIQNVIGWTPGDFVRNALELGKFMIWNGNKFQLNYKFVLRVLE